MSPAKKDDPIELLPADVAQISPLYNSFAKRFSTADANQILTAGSHRRDRLKKSDWFADCIVVAISYECFSDPTWHRAHGFEAGAEAYSEWIRENIDFTEYQEPGDMVDLFKKKFKPYL